MQVLYIILFTIILNWMISLHLLAQTQKDRNVRVIAYSLSIISSLVLGTLIYVTT